MVARSLHGHYWLVPIFTSAMWLTTIIGLLGWWARDHFEEYRIDSANIVFISTVGAEHQAFFIVFASLTALGYALTVVLERHLRHVRRIPGSVRAVSTWLDIFSLAFAFLGSIFLVLLSAFNSEIFSTVHWSCTLLFVLCTAISVFLQTYEVFTLAADHPRRHKTLLTIAILKSIFLGFAVVLAISFMSLYGVCRGNAYPGDQRCDRIVSAAAVCEWAISFVLAFFFLTYCVDLWPAHRAASKGLTEDGRMVEDRALADESGAGRGKPDAPYAIARDMGPNHTREEYAAAMRQSHHDRAVSASQAGSPHVSASEVSSALGHAPQMSEARPSGTYRI